MIESKVPIKEWSEALSEPLLKLYSGGGWALALLFLGSLFLLVGALLAGGFGRVWLSFIGFVLLLAAGGYILVMDVRVKLRSSPLTAENKELINVVQEAALLLTDLSHQLQAYAFKHQDTFTRPRYTARQVVEEIQRSFRFAGLPGIAELERGDYPKAVVEIRQYVAKTIEQVKDALVEANPILLREFVEKLKAATLLMNALLAE